MAKPIYKGKIMIIEAIDGRKFQVDLNVFPNVPFGYDKGPTDTVYRQIVVAIATAGYTDVEASDDSTYVHLGPSQIKSITIKFIRADGNLEIQK